MILVCGAGMRRSFPPALQLAALLAPHFTVLNYDRRGRGESSDTAPYAVEREIEDLEAMIDEAGGSAFVYGHSSGATLALETARRPGGKIKKLALYEPPFMIAESDRPTVDHLAQLKELLAAGRREDMVEYFMTKVTGMPAEAVAPMKALPMWRGLTAMAHTLVYDLTIMGDYSFPAKQMSGITTTTLAMDGGASPAWAANAAQSLAYTLPNAKRRTLAGQTHNVDPTALTPVLVEFFNG